MGDFVRMQERSIMSILELRGRTGNAQHTEN